MRIVLRCTATATALLLLAACASSGSSAGRHAPAEAAAPAPVIAEDASYDWHGLVRVPFGTLLKETPLPLHEVLLFHDEAHPAAESDNKDCYAADGVPPRFLGRQPDQYLLCFDHDHLNRYEAAVRLAAGEAPQTFARACALWLNSGAPATQPGNTCEGRDGGVSFSGRLGQLPGEATATVSMTLTNAPPHEAVRDAAHDK